MKKALFSLMMGAVLALSSCTPGPTPTAAPETLTPTLALPTATAVPPTPTPVPQGRTLLVTSAADSGPGTLRQAMQDAQSHDTITFDSAIFPPNAPVTISLSTGLPELSQGDLTIDASNTGVILDGSNITSPDSQRGLSISPDNNIVRGLQIVGFSDAGIGLYGGAENNVIGGDRSVEDGPLGQGNLISGNGSFGVGLWDEGTSHNTIQGNYIGINMDGTATWGHARDGIHSNGATQNLITGNVIGGNESAGVYLCCVQKGRNTVSGNLIGIGPDGIPLGNLVAGILIDRTSHNVVGPGNLIAHNLGEGIAFWEDTPNNTVTQNSIRDNGGQGIGVSGASDAARQPPLIINWDLEAGSLSGVACGNCTVEIFSDSGDEGANYEGQTEAEENGAFTFMKGAPLTGPFLTTTATDPGGSTGEFSLPTDGSIQNLNLQNGNALPIFRLQTKPSIELTYNRIGGVGGVGEAEALWNTGVKWMHLIVDYYGQWQYVDWGREEYALDPQEEQVVDDLLSHGVRIKLVLDVWEWQNRIVDYRSEEGIQKYLNWVRYLVRHFKGRIEYYEILNEPEPTVTSLGITADDYINLVKRTVPIIREEDSRAKIVVGSIPDTRFDHVRDFMWDLLHSDVMSLVDGFSWHPMFGAAPSDDPRGVRDPDAPQMANYWENYPTFVEEIMRVSTSAGFEGEYFATDMIWRTPANPHVAEPDGFTDISAAKYYARAIIIHLGLNVTTGIAIGPEPRSYSAIRALCTVMAGAETEDLPVVIESAATNIKYYGFALPNGDRLYALWTDGAAVEFDPGVSATLRFPGSSAQKVIGIDVLNGIEQELITETVDGNLVIRDLLVKDYPIILRLTNQ